MTTENKFSFSSPNIFLANKRHVNNLAPTYFFKEDTLKEIKRVGLTLEMIEEIAAYAQIYVYPTQITIHGVITEEQIKLLKIVQGYKSCFRNDNGTLAVNYSAVDIQKKEKLNNLLKHIRKLFNIKVPELLHNGNGTIFEIWFKEKELRDEMEKKVSLSLFHGRKSVGTEYAKNKPGGPYYLKIEVALMKEDMIWTIINNWTDITYEKYQEAILLQQAAQEERQQKSGTERAQLIQRFDQGQNKMQENYKASLKELVHLPRWDGKVEKEKDMILVSGAKTESDLRFQFVWLRKNPWDWRYECHASHDNKESLPGGGFGHFFRFHTQASRDRFLAEYQWYVWEEKEKIPLALAISA